MLVRAPRIVRFLSVSRSEIRRVARPMKQARGADRTAPPPPLEPTAVPPAELDQLDSIEVVDRLDDLAHHLCTAAEAPRDGIANPQEDHSF